MYRHRSSEVVDEFIRLDRTILGLLVDPDDQRPWSEMEIAREISTPGHVRDSLERLRHAGLVHRYSGLVSATHAAARMYEIDQSSYGLCEQDRGFERVVLAVLLAHLDTEPPLSQQDVVGETSREGGMEITDALDSLGAAGLVDRSGGLVWPSRAARRYSQIMTL
jgi:hypothetical protein